MAYQRVTLQQLKDRLRERLAEFDKFWSEPAQEAALNEAIMVWQLLTADYPQKEEIELLAPTTIVKPTLDERPATFLRIRCKPEVAPPPALGTIHGTTGAFGNWTFRLYKDGELLDTQFISYLDNPEYTWTDMAEGDYYLTVTNTDPPENPPWVSTTETLTGDNTIELYAYGGGG